MIEKQISKPSAIRRNLRRLNIIRSIAIGGQFLALYYFGFVESIGLPVVTLGWILISYAIILLLSSWRSLWRQPITDQEFFGHLLLDMLFFSALLYFSGGATNPFISYYLVPISIVAATLPWTYTWAITLLSLTAYSLLLFNHYPIESLSPSNGTHHTNHGNGALNLHLLGMWATFVVSAVLITYFVVKMASELRQQQQLLSAQREERLLDEQVLAVATLAAGTAHELGTPLNTMQILLDEMSAQPQNEESAHDLATLQQQLSNCRQTLKQLVATADINSDRQWTHKNIRHYLNELIERWQLLRPGIDLQVTLDKNAPNVDVQLPPTVSQSLHNLLNNAADASDTITVSFCWTHEQLHITIRDYGPGIPTDVMEQLGKPFISTKSKGLGLGLFLTQSTLNRIGGAIIIKNAENSSGTLTTVTLPLQLSEVTHG